MGAARHKRNGQNPSDQRGAPQMHERRNLHEKQNADSTACYTRHPLSGVTQLYSNFAIFYPVTRWSVENCHRRSDSFVFVVVL